MPIDMKAHIEKQAANCEMSCEDFQGELDKIDFAAMAEVDSFGEPGYSVQDGVATIKVRGMLVPDAGVDFSAYGITGYDIIAQYVENANDDGAVKEITLDVDSNGGFVRGLQQAIDSIAGSSKPISTFASGNMASAAYWLGVTAQSITSNETSKIGSIGVYAEHTDRSKALRDRGIKKDIYKSGFWKGAFSSDRPLSAREKTRIQEGVDTQAQIFFEHVSEFRGLSVDEIAAFEGDTFSANDALSNGLIDAIKESNMTDTSTNPTQAAPVAQTPATPETQAAAPAMPPVDFEAQLAAAVEQGRQSALAEAQALVERNTKLQAHEKAPSAVKDLLASDKFASVAVDDLVAVMDAIPESVAQIMDTEGGAGVEADPQNIVPETEADAKAAAQKAAVEKLPTLKAVI